jgi:NAD(P)-dependent dehydrogenase (short-subunit alcohol dehydrogenase family)
MQSSNGHSQVVVITGATAGVGRATARAFARRGARLGLIARGKDGLEATKRDVENLGGQALTIQADVVDLDAMHDAASRVENAFGPIDVWVNNAMVTVYSRLADVDPDEYRRVTDVCYHGQVFGTMAALKRMRPRNRGVIVSVGSALAYRGIPLQAAYCGAKHATNGMLDSLRSELLEEGSDIQVVSVHLPAINTPQFVWGRTHMPRKPQPVPPIFQPEVAADAVVYAANEGRNRREILVGGPTVEVVVGNKLAPRLADHYLARNGVVDQMLDEPVEEDRKDNLFEPLEGDYGAHGPFDDRAKAVSVQFWLNRRRRLFAAAGAGLAALAGAVWAGRR